jgi:DNA-binding MarR family transcriptional regulator
MHQHTTSRHLTALQNTILQWLYTEGNRHTDGPDGVSYPTLVQAVNADKASVTAGLRRLMHRGLVLTTLPRGSWRRCVALTEQGRKHARTLLKEERKHNLKRGSRRGGRRSWRERW